MTRSQFLRDPVLRFVVNKLQVASPKRIVLFGSRARGDHEVKSDFDVAVEGVNSDSDRWIRAKLDIQDSAPTLLKIDLVNLHDVGAELRKRIKKEGVVLYESNE